MRIKHNFIKISILQPERRFNAVSSRNKLVGIINESNQPILLSELIESAKNKLGYDEKKVLAIISKLKQVGFLKLEAKELGGQV